MNPWVVVTRPRDDSEAIAAQVRGKGYNALIAPMLEIGPIGAVIPAPDSYSALAFTSANAVRIFAGRDPERGKRAYAVGNRTAQSLREANFIDIRDCAGDAEALARTIGREMEAGSRILHLSGKIVARELSELLRDREIQVDRIPIYDACPVPSLSPELRAALYARTVAFILLFSPRTAAILGTLARDSGCSQSMEAATALCLSPAVAAQAAALPWRGILSAERPTSAALMELLPPLDEHHGYRSDRG